MTACDQFEEALLGGEALLPPELEEHAGGCQRCAAVRDEHAAYEALVGRARETLAALKLSPTAWARVRSSVDERDGSAPLRGWRGWLAGGVALGAAAAVAAVALALPVAGAPERSVATEGSPAASALAPHRLMPPPPAVAAGPAGPPAAALTAPAGPSGGSLQGPTAAATPGAPAREAGVPGRVSPQGPAVAARPGAPPREGGVLSAAESERVIAAFGRHRLTLAPGTELGLLRWGEDAVVLDLRRGSVEADVTRRSSDEVFEVRAGDVRVHVVGTLFRVTRTPEGSAEVSVQHGAVTVTGPSRAVTRVVAGETRRLPLSEAIAAADALFEAELERPAAVPADRGHRGRRAGAHPRGPARRQGKGDKVVVRQFEAEAAAGEGAAPPLSDAMRDRLAQIVWTIQAGSCEQAIGRLRTEAGQLKRATPAEVYYLMGWCYRKLGRPAAAAFFTKYRMTAASRRWRLPSSAEELPPMPGVGALYR